MKKTLMMFMMIFLLTGCSKDIKYSNNLFYMDTYIKVDIYTNDKEKAKNILTDVDNIYKNYHNLTDRYNKYGDLINIYYINEMLETNKYIELDSKLIDILNYGKEYYIKTNGMVNIALGNITAIWHNYRELGTGIPSEEELKNSGSNNIDDILIKENQIMKLSNVKLDLGCIAKGYATEEVGKYLESKGINKYLINAGGNVKVGKHYNNNAYKIGIENPTNKEDLYQIVKANNTSIVTSGSYNRYYVYQNKKYHHIIDPKNFYPPNNMQSVTIVTKDSAYGDVLSTYLFILNIEEGIKYVNSLDNVEAIWYANDGTIHKSKGFSKYE